MQEPAWRAALNDYIAEKCDQIAQRFTHPRECKITVIVRTPWLQDGGVVVSNDDYGAAIAEIQRLVVKSPVTP